MVYRNGGRVYLSRMVEVWDLIMKNTFLVNIIDDDRSRFQFRSVLNDPSTRIGVAEVMK